MQPAGHSSTRDLSLTSTHGSAITQVMGGVSSLVTCLHAAPRGRPGPRMGGVLAADVRHLHLRPYFACAAGLAGAQLGVAVGPQGPDGAELLTHVVVGGACAQRAAQVVACPGEQAGVELAVC